MKLYIGAGLIALGAYSFGNIARMKRRSLRATGRVVRVMVSSSKHYDDSTSTTSYTPVISFRAADGAEYECHGDSSPREPDIGRKVKIEYDPQHPRTAWERGSGSMWVLPLLITIGGIVLLAMGVRERE